MTCSLLRRNVAVRGNQFCASFMLHRHHLGFDTFGLQGEIRSLEVPLDVQSQVRALWALVSAASGRQVRVLTLWPSTSRCFQASYCARALSSHRKHPYFHSSDASVMAQWWCDNLDQWQSPDFICTLDLDSSLQRFCPFPYHWCSDARFLHGKIRPRPSRSRSRLGSAGTSWRLPVTCRAGCAARRSRTSDACSPRSKTVSVPCACSDWASHTFYSSVACTPHGAATCAWTWDLARAPALCQCGRTRCWRSNTCCPRLASVVADTLYCSNKACPPAACPWCTSQCRSQAVQ